MHSEQSAGRFALAFGTLGIVFGDIGTSPIYAFRESFEVSDLEVSESTAFGVASLVFWALLIVISGLGLVRALAELASG